MGVKAFQLINTEDIHQATNIKTSHILILPLLNKIKNMMMNIIVKISFSNIKKEDFLQNNRNFLIHKKDL